jgi:hypothetical protein
MVFWDAPGIESVVHAAFGTSPGTYEGSHSISGAFSVSLTSGPCLAALTLASIPATQGRRPGTPVNYFDLGWVGAFSSSYMMEWQELHFVNLLWWPRSLRIDQLAGWLQPGITGTLYTWVPAVP